MSEFTHRAEKRSVKGIGDVIFHVALDPAMPGYDYLGREATGVYDSNDKRELEQRGYLLLSGPYGVDVYRRSPDKL